MHFTPHRTSYCFNRFPLLQVNTEGRGGESGGESGGERGGERGAERGGDRRGGGRGDIRFIKLLNKTILVSGVYMSSEYKRKKQKNEK